MQKLCHYVCYRGEAILAMNSVSIFHETVKLADRFDGTRCAARRNVGTQAKQLQVAIRQYPR